MRTIVAIALTLAANVARADPPPSLVLWAWERPEDLRFLPREVGVAYHRATVTVSPDGVRVAPRRQPLRVTEGAWQMAVVRVELRPRTATFTDAARARVAELITRVAREPGVRGVQVDFDVPASQRAAHRALLTELRRALAPRTWLSVTALASWCVGDPWLDGTPADEVVPMVFTMGRGGAEVLATLRREGSFPAAVCRGSVGWAAGEPVVTLRGVRRRYVFSARPWTLAAARPWLRAP